MNRQQEEQERQRDSAAILKRIREETEPQVGAGVERLVLNAREHFTASDADQTDRVEVIGTRIGRFAGMLFFLFLAGSLIVTYLLP